MLDPSTTPGGKSNNSQLSPMGLPGGTLSPVGETEATWGLSEDEMAVRNPHEKGAVMALPARSRAVAGTVTE